MKSETQPIISDFDLCKELRGTCKASSASSLTGALPGTPEYMAPEVLEGCVAEATSADMYSFGVVLWKCFFPNEPCVLLPERDTVLVPAHESLHLRSLLAALLQRDSARRPSAEEALIHPFFSTSMVEELRQSGELLDTERKLAVFRRFLAQLKEERGWFAYDKDPRSLRLRRSSLFASVLQHFERALPEDLLMPICVEYEVPPAVVSVSLSLSLSLSLSPRAAPPSHAG
jgi:serine/threonine protein kinase